MPLCSELMSRPKKAVAGYRPERTTPGGPSRAGRGRQYCKLRWLLSPKPEFSKCIFELKMPRPVIWQRFTSTNSCHEPPLGGGGGGGLSQYKKEAFHSGKSAHVREVSPVP